MWVGIGRYLPSVRSTARRRMPSVNTLHLFILIAGGDSSLQQATHTVRTITKVT